MMRPQKFPIRRGRARERETPLVFEGDETGPSANDGDERELIPGDDCEAIADDPADELEEETNEVEEEEEERNEEEVDVRIDEEVCAGWDLSHGDVRSEGIGGVLSADAIRRRQAAGDLSQADPLPEEWREAYRSAGDSLASCLRRRQEAEERRGDCPR